MSDISKLIDGIAVDALGDPLKSAGYRKSGRTWRRRTNDSIQVINVQGSRHSGGASGRFFVNAGVYFPALATRLAIFQPTDTPDESHCHLRTRVTPPRKNGWEVHLVGGVKPEPDAGRVLGAVFSWLNRRADRRAPQTNDKVPESELREALEQRALPWLNQMADLRAARQALIDEGDLHTAAAASLELAEQREARRLFEDLLAKRTGASDDLRAWGRANGLLSLTGLETGELCV